MVLAGAAARVADAATAPTGMARARARQRALEQLGVAPASAMATVLDADNRLEAVYVESAASLVFAAPEDRPVFTHGSCVIDSDST